MNKTEFIDKLLHLGSTIEICNSTQTSKKAKELAHTLLDEYLQAINYTHFCKSDSELLPKRLSNEAYKKAQIMSYAGFVEWWDEQQVQVIVYNVNG